MTPDILDIGVVAKELKDYLDDVGGLGLITIGALDPTPDELGVIAEYGGLQHEARFGVIGIGYERPTIQVLFRGKPHDYATPMIRARQAFQALASVQPGMISSYSNTQYLEIIPIQSPFSLGKDHNERYEIACNYLIKKELK
jgi:hypothetical protein